MATAVKRKLSGSTNGRGIKIAATATPGTLLHTAVAGTTAGTFDEIWIEATNNDTQTRDLTLEWGGVADPDDLIVIPVPAQSGLQLLIPGNILQNGLVVRAFAEVANKLIVHGYVNSITD